MHAERVLTLRMLLQNQRYRSPGQSATFVRTLVERARSLPGVEHAAIANSLPLTNYNLGTVLDFEEDGKTVLPGLAHHRTDGRGARSW